MRIPSARNKKKYKKTAGQMNSKKVESSRTTNHCSAGNAQPAGTGTGTSEATNCKSIWRTPVPGIPRASERQPREEQGEEGYTGNPGA